MDKNSNRAERKKRRTPLEPAPEFEPAKIKIVVGLGNPDPGNARTYHNAGFLALDRLSPGGSAIDWRERKEFSYSKIGKTIIARPRTFMNESGEAVRRALGYFKAKSENLLVIHDDSDIEAGRYKIDFGRGAAGHRGVSSVMERLKTRDFWRVRIGVRSQRGKAGDFVLKKITPADRQKLDRVFEELKKKLLLTD